MNEQEPERINELLWQIQFVIRVGLSPLLANELACERVWGRKSIKFSRQVLRYRNIALAFGRGKRWMNGHTKS